MKKTILILVILFGFIAQSQEVAIIVTDSLKIYNREIFKNYQVDDIKPFRGLPISFAGPTKNYQRTDGYNKLPLSVPYNDGFRYLVEPIYDEATQSLSGIYFDIQQDNFTYNIIQKSQAEIDAYAQALLDADQYQDIINIRVADGKLLYYRVIAKIERAWRNNQINTALASYANSYFDNTLEPLLRGNWQQAKTNLETPPNDVSQILNTFYSDINQEVIDYSTETYSKN